MITWSFLLQPHEKVELLGAGLQANQAVSHTFPLLLGAFLATTVAFLILGQWYCKTVAFHPEISKGDIYQGCLCLFSLFLIMSASGHMHVNTGVTRGQKRQIPRKRSHRQS